jgi:hypothetical protein
MRLLVLVRSAIASMRAPLRPFSANSSVAASSLSSRRRAGSRGAQFRPAPRRIEEVPTGRDRRPGALLAIGAVDGASRRSRQACERYKSRARRHERRRTSARPSLPRNKRPGVALLTFFVVHFLLQHG